MILSPFQHPRRLAETLVLPLTLFSALLRLLLAPLLDHCPPMLLSALTLLSFLTKRHPHHKWWCDTWRAASPFFCRSFRFF
ncbi:hypothetical protein T484DRAFT_1954891 [Baffinella frigidus]|nr:hypothetical protein T484DRAFT_1954891 [Cryptophyta sp. CCMP2293]